MKNSIKLALSLIISSISPNESMAGEQKIANSLLWEVTGKNLKESSYLTGTIHIMCEKDFAVLPKVEKAIKSSDQLVLELDFNDPDEMADMQKMMVSGSLLTESLSADQQERMSLVLKNSLNMTLEQVNSYSLNAIYSMLMVTAIECPNKKFLDMELTALAKAEGKALGGLETVKQQLSFFSKAYSNDFLLSQLEIMPEYIEVFDDMVNAFKNENLNALMELFQDERFNNKDIAHWLLEVRNKNWVKNMPEIMQNNSTVFAMGAAHLAGEFGVIQLLQDAGYTVKPVLN